jgi:hypothetical protein
VRLSEAIRLGSMLGPQAFGTLFETRERRKWLFGLIGPRVLETATCAMGAADLAVAGHDDETVSIECPRGASMGDRDGIRITIEPGSFIKMPKQCAEWNYGIFKAPAVCPTCGFAAEVFAMVPHLNDVHRWTRERIADYVELLESTVPTPVFA